MHPPADPDSFYVTGTDTGVGKTLIATGLVRALNQSGRRTRGLKLHVVYNPVSDHPMRIEITPANVNDVTVGRSFAIEPGATYVFDKAYVDYAWWTQLDARGCRFVTRRPNV